MSETLATSELDHVFICASIGAPEADRLVEFGLTEGTRNAHPGQGTANRRFFFHNAMLELLWVHDAAEAQSELVRPTRLWERWAGRSGGACPLALCFRPRAHQAGALRGSGGVVISSMPLLVRRMLSAASGGRVT